MTSAAVNQVLPYSVTGSDAVNFNLRGGVYTVALAANSWGTVTLNVLSADETTWLPFQTWSSNVAATMTLAAGRYQFAYSSVDTATLSLIQQPPSSNWRLEALSQPRPISSSGGITTLTTLGTDTQLNLASSGSAGGAEGTWLLTYDTTGATNSSDVGVGSGNAESGASGVAYLYTGNTGSGTSGDIDIGTGNSSGGDSGNIVITT